MKKLIKKEVTLCDVCKQEEEYPNTCLNCGKEICYECSKTKGVSYNHSVWACGSGDGFYCKECDSTLKKTGGDELYTAYQKIVLLRNEQERFYKDFTERAKRAETDLKKLINTLRVEVKDV